MVKPLNNMCFSNMKPAFNDHESLTAIEMIGKFYSKINEIIEEYTSFSESTKQYIESFTNGTNQSVDLFKLSISQKFQDFIDVVDLRLKSMDSEIDKSIIIIRNNMYDEIKKITTEMNEAGEISDAILEALGGYNIALSDLKSQLESLNMNFLSSGSGQTVATGTLQRIAYVVQSFIKHQLDLGYAHKHKEDPTKEEAGTDYHDSAWVLNKEVTKIIGGNQYGCLGYACNCTTFVLHCLLGIPYEASRYIHTTASTHKVGYAGYSANIWNEPITLSNFDLYYNTQRMFERFVELGQARNINKDYSNVSAGDVVWFAPKPLYKKDDNGKLILDENGEKIVVDREAKPYDITHVGIVLATSGLYTSADDKLTPAVLIAECTSTTYSIQCKWYTPFDLAENNVNWCAKPNYQYTNDIESDVILELNNGFANYSLEKKFGLKNGDLITFDFDFTPNDNEQYVFITGLCDVVGKYIQLKAGNRLKELTSNIGVGETKHITFTTPFLLLNEGTGEFYTDENGVQKESTYTKTFEPVDIKGIAIRVQNGNGNDTISNFKMYRGLPGVEKKQMLTPSSLNELKTSIESLLFETVNQPISFKKSVVVRPKASIKLKESDATPLFFSGQPFELELWLHQTTTYKYIVAKTFYQCEEITLIYDTKNIDGGWKITKNTL